MYDPVYPFRGHVHDNKYGIKKYNKTTFYLILKLSLMVSSFFAFVGIIMWDIYFVIFGLIIGFFGAFVVLSVFFLIEQLFFMILNKIKGKKQE